MNATCPSCRQPIDKDDTQQYVDGSSEMRCSHCGLILPEQEATIAYSTTSTSIDKRIANFSLIRPLGRGGFGDVWLAQDKNLGRQVALKLPKTTGKDAKLLHEAQTAAKLRHPNIVSIYEVGVDEEQVFIASEYIDGDDLQSELASGRPETGRAASIVATIARAVHHAHEHGVVHRDLKPANIILNKEGEPFITDFGIAKHLSVDDTISTDGQVVGTVSYMSPEQARGSTRDTDSRADIYALGVMLFELLTEYRPFRGNARAVIHQKIYEDAPSPRKLVPSLPRDLETICLKCLELEPAKRYSSAAEVADELDRFRQSIPIKARPISRGEKVWRWGRRQPVIAGLLFSLILSLTTGLVGTSFFWFRAAESAHQTRDSLYRTHMNLASRLWERGDIAGLRQTLNHYSAPSPNAGMREFEWYYYSMLLEPFVQTVNYGDVVGDVAVSHDGSLFAAAGNDRVVQVWKTKTGTLVRTLTLPARTHAIEFSRVDDRLASATADGVVRLWNPRNHDRAVGELEHGAGLTHTRFSPDGKMLVSAGRNGRALIWNFRSGKQLIEVPGIHAEAQAVRFDGTGRLLAIAAKNRSVYVWDTTSQQHVHRFSTNSLPLSLDFVDENSVVAVGTYGSSVQFWSIDTGEKIASARLDAAVGDLEYLSSADLLAAVTTGNELSLLNRDRRAMRTLVTHTLTHGMLAKSVNEGHLLAGSGDGSLKLLNVPSLLRQDVFWHDTHVRDVTFDHARGEIAICAGDGSVRLLNPATGEQQELVEATGREMLALARQPQGRLLACCGMTRAILLFDCERRELVASIDVPHSGFSSLDFSRDGRLLAAGSRGGSLHVYQSDQWDAPVLTIEGADVQVTDVRFSPYTDLLAVSYSNGQVLLRAPTQTDSEGQRIEIPTTPLSLEFCNGGDLLAVGTQAGEIHLYDVATVGVVRVVKAHSSRINALAAFPGGRRLVSGGRDRELRIWDVATGDLVTRLPGHDRQVFAMSIAPDGRTIASAGLAGDVRLWRSKASTR